MTKNPKFWTTIIAAWKQIVGLSEGRELTGIFLVATVAVDVDVDVGSC